MQGEALTPDRRRALYEKATEWATDEMPVDGDADQAHLLVHALAQTPDGELEVREDYLDDTVPEDQYTPAETISGWIEFYGMPEYSPAPYEEVHSPTHPDPRCKECGERLGDSERAEVYIDDSYLRRMAGGQHVLVDDIPESAFGPYLVHADPCYLANKEKYSLA